MGCTIVTELRPSDDRKTHLITRGNVDGIISAALFLAWKPSTRVSFVTSGDLAVDVLRKDISSNRFFLVDLGLTPRLIKTLNDKAKTPQRVCYLDHHEQSEVLLDRLDPRTEAVVQQGISAAAVAYEHLGLNGAHRHLVALADLVEYCATDRLDQLARQHGVDRLEREAKMLDFSWRYHVEDDRFRYHAARRLAGGRWPSEVAEVRSRYFDMMGEQRWDRALERVRDRIEIKHNVALLRFGRHKPSLYGFGSRALSEVARELGAKVAIMLNRRSNVSSLSLRRTDGCTTPEAAGLNLGQFVTEFTAQHGIVGGGHPQSAGAKIPTSSVPAFLHEMYCLA